MKFASVCLIGCIIHFWFPPCDALSVAKTSYEPRDLSLAQELDSRSIESASSWVSAALGDDSEIESDGQSISSKIGRYASARTLALEIKGDNQARVPSNELVYGELSVPVLATILDAVGVRKGDRFLDIGSGDGGLVLGASLLYPDHLEKSQGVELIPGLVERSILHLDRLREIFQKEQPDLQNRLDNVAFLAGNIYEHDQHAALRQMVEESTFVVCFATTWSANNNEGSSKTSLQGRGKIMESDGFCWEGDLRLECPDTAPYSIASLYTKK